MNQPTESSLKATNEWLMNHLKSKANALRPGIDWAQVQFNRNFQGQIIGLQSDDPALHHWLQGLKIDRSSTPEPGQ